MTDTMQIRWIAKGFTEDVVTCGFCGRDELKGTVRMVAMTDDNEIVEEVYAGVVCAAKRSGRKAGEIRTEATQYDRQQHAERRAAWTAWSGAHSVWFCEMRDAALGRDFSYEALRVWRELPEVRAAEVAWLLANPEPSRVWR